MNGGGEEGDQALIRRLIALPEDARAAILRGLNAEQSIELHERWPAWALPGQLVSGEDWRVALIRAGRGFGKTRAGAEWVSEVARRNGAARIALVGDTAEDVRQVMIEGESGLLAVARDGEAPAYYSTSAELAFTSGARAYVYSAAAPDKLRGPQHHAAWCDELAKWRDGERAWDNLMLGMRLGDNPQVLVTTTPRQTPLMRRLLAMPGLVETRGSTRDNPHLPRAFVTAMEADYGGTRLGRQELDGEMIAEVEGALWSPAMIEACGVAEAPELVRVVVAVDPPAGTNDGEGDACGIVAAGVDADGVAYVLEDASVTATSPTAWARAVAACAVRYDADCVVAEKNQGGEMVRHVLTGADQTMPVRLVHAVRGKSARAEPVAIRYERGEVKHVGAFPALEEQMCGILAGGGYAGPGRSPDRADALVWALTELMLTRRGMAAVRGL